MSKGHDESAYFDHVQGSKGDSSMILWLLVPIDVAPYVSEIGPQSLLGAL